MSELYFFLPGRAVPQSLRSIPRPCTGLYVRGQLPPDDAPRIAVVGTRTPSPEGRDVAYTMSRDLARAGVVVVSGLARGIDAAAHRGALDGGGITVGILGSGIDVLYPTSSRCLAQEMTVRGAVISEYPPRTAPRSFHFVQRNRLVAGYTLGTVVVEAGIKSGALITAGLSAGLGREVWAVPGDPCRPTCRGNNRLLRDGAGVVLDGQDVLVAVGLLEAGQRSPAAPADGDRDVPPGLSPAEAMVFKTLRNRSGSAESLARRTGLEAGVLLQALSRLELCRVIRRSEEGYRIDSRG